MPGGPGAPGLDHSRSQRPGRHCPARRREGSALATLSLHRVQSPVFLETRYLCLAKIHLLRDKSDEQTTRRAGIVTIPHGIPEFVARAEASVATAASTLRFAETRSKRVLRLFSVREAAMFLGFSKKVIHEWLEHPQAPTPKRNKAGTVFLSLDDIFLLRGLMHNRPQGRRGTLHWRKPGEPIPVITTGSQKGGTGKSISCALLAQAANILYGLRVAVIDADPQATISLYFADDETDIAGLDVGTFTRFMGVGSPGEPPLIHDAATLDSFWLQTPWPGIRLMPGGAPIQEAEIAMYFLAQGEDKQYRRVYRLLHDAIQRWSDAHPVITQTQDLVDDDGQFKPETFRQAMTETVDLIVIDSAPSLTLSQLNTVVAASSLIIPNTMRGFDLSTTRIYLSSLNDYLRFIATEDDPVVFQDRPSYILPTIVSTMSDADILQVGELYGHDPDVICPIFYGRSEAVANAARDYQSIYEYTPPPGRRKSTNDFIANANAVSEAILTRAIPGLPPRGFANDFIARTYPADMVPPWTDPEEG